MTRPKYAKPDDNQRELVKGLRAIGAVVWVTASLPAPVLDLVVFWRGRIGIVEVKMPGCKNDLTPGEFASIAALEAVGVPVCVATCVEDVVKAWGEPRWRVVNQSAVECFNDLMEKALEKAVRLTRARITSPYWKGQICEVRDALMELSQAACEAMIWEGGEGDGSVRQEKAWSWRRRSEAKGGSKISQCRVGHPG